MLYIIVVSFILGDILTGVFAALYKNEFSSKKMREGLFHKVAILFAFALSIGAEFVCVYYDFLPEVPTAAVCGGYIVVMEFASIIENIAKVNPDVKKFFRKGRRT